MLSSAAPLFAEPAVSALMADTYGVSGRVLASLDSERDQVVLFGDGGRQLIVKLSNISETSENIELEEAAAVWMGSTDPTLPASVPIPVPGSDVRHAVVRHPESGSPHVLRAYDRLPGVSGLDGAALALPAVMAYGATVARCARSLRGFHHPSAGRRVAWHVEERQHTRRLTERIEDAETRALVERAYDGFEERVSPVWQSLRGQVVHGDLTLDNVLVDGAEISGVLDLGDLAHSTLVSDIAAALAPFSASLDGEDLFRAFRVFLDGYRSVCALEPLELAVLGDTIALRAAITMGISSWRRSEHPGNAAYIAGWDTSAVRVLRLFDTLGPDEVTVRLGGIPAEPATADLVRRRAATFGEALAPLTYTEPLHLVSGNGATLTDAGGTTYVDAYNNVPVVGHAHPRVASAVADQARLLSTNLRYLHPRAIELAERLAATMPPGLDTVLLVNSGSEAVDMAWRLAAAVTGRRGALVTDFAYHGVTAATAALSPEEWRTEAGPGHVQRFAAPWDPADPDPLGPALARLRGAGHDPALVVVDSAYTSDGILTPGAAYHQRLGTAARAAGALVVADEVQAGFGRAGDHLWSFVGAGLDPDIVTLGKPMGNGYPVAAVATRRSYVDALAEEAEFFSTFAGSPVASAAGLAVLDVLADLELVAHADAMGRLLRTRLHAATEGCGAVREVRGRGLLVGLDLGGLTPDQVAGVADRAKAQGVLVGTTGPRYDVLKIRPPLVISEPQVEWVAEVVGSAVLQIADC